MGEEILELASYHKWIGKPNYTSCGIPIYTFDELCFDATIHLLILVWTIISSHELLQISHNLNIIIYIISIFILICTSFAFNIIGCGFYYKANLLRKLDHAAIFLCIAGIYTAILKPSIILSLVWIICITCSISKLWLGRKVEDYYIIPILLLILLPLIKFWNSAYCRHIVFIIIIMIIGFTFYINNILKGATGFWHICILFIFIIVWHIIYLHVKNKEVCE